MCKMVDQFVSLEFLTLSYNNFCTTQERKQTDESIGV